MDEKDLERLMRARLEETQDFDFREEDWEELAHRLKRKRRWPLFWWPALLGAILLIALSATAWHYYQEYTTANEALVLAENTIKELNNKTSQSNTTVPKTVRKTVEVIDTVYKTVIIEKHITKQVPAQIAGIDSLEQEETFIADAAYKVNDSKVQNLINQDSLEIDVSLLANLPDLPLTSLDYKQERKIWRAIQLPHSEQKKEQKKLKKEIKKTKHVGLRFGWANTQNPSIPEPNDSLPGNPFLQELNRNAWNIGVAGEMNLNKKLKIIAGVNLEQQYYNTNQEGTGELFDQVSYDTLTYGGPQLLMTRFKESSLRYTLGVKYQIFNEKKWMPFIGFRAEAGHILNRLITVDYQVLDGSMFEWSTQVRNRRLPPVGLRYISPVVGLDTQLSDKWKLQFEAVYFIPSEQYFDHLRKKLGLHLGFLYQLN